MLAQEVQAVLQRQGWSPTRRVSIRDWIAQLGGVGCTVLPKAESILQNFGGLEIVPVKTPMDAYSPEIIRFDPVTDVLSEVERIEFWQQRLATTFTPLGVLYPSEGILLLAENGQICFEWGNIIVDCGDSFEDALESTLVFARRKPIARMVDSEGRLVPV
ncbi:SUKH-3 domain-containing protein [Tuwongella immobilis]|uniref:SUKH-3 immunity protein n=1 Tax=Tuwongella immobilis TaxID=692036 RepID=A0A6C2YL40_9BACT|nr:Uncharacterized protein OS=Comamonas testosteroni GN=P353_01660 PE=4 SV=1: SUKH-3 [Tuwongella immobilis]VTS00368.1 Uncharacterized protein OS=Comamonas testosteroni GN=P353_01660 PE=4 SV=1: SUKH-3 [Tuwongella immobilis]